MKAGLLMQSMRGRISRPAKLSGQHMDVHHLLMMQNRMMFTGGGPHFIIWNAVREQAEQRLIQEAEHD